LESDFLLIKTFAEVLKPKNEERIIEAKKQSIEASDL